MSLDKVSGKKSDRSRYAESSIYKCTAMQMAKKKNERAPMDEVCTTADDLASGWGLVCLMGWLSASGLTGEAPELGLVLLGFAGVGCQASGLQPMGTSAANRAPRPSMLLKTSSASWPAPSTTLRRMLIWLLDTSDQSGNSSKVAGKPVRSSLVRARVLTYCHHTRLRSRRLEPPCINAMQSWSPLSSVSS
jgi:hypothetical protein